MGNLKARNATTTLGLLWWVLNPVLLGAVYWFVFGLLFSRGSGSFGAPFLVYLLSGMFPFYFTQSAMTGGVNSIINNTQLLANLRFPRTVLPIASILEGYVGFLTSLLAFFLIVGPIYGVWPTVATLWILPTMIVHLVFSLGLSLIVARLAVPFRDLNNLVPYFTRIWLYLSPILYSQKTIEKAPSWARHLAEANPLVPILRMYRFSLAGIPTDASNALIASGTWAIVIFAFGAFWFIKYEGKMARYL
jgi:teichoic acid transport system permease protein